MNSSIFVLDLETGNIVDQIAGMGTRACDAMKRIAAPMIGGMVTSTILTLVIISVIYDMWCGRQLVRTGATQTFQEGES